MTVRFVKRAASEIMGRGESAIKINTGKLEDVKKAMTRDDVKRLIKDGSLYAVKEKHNLSMNAKKLRARRMKGRGRGQGRRRGAINARRGGTWIKKSRSQRFMLKRLKESGKIDTMTFNKYYHLVKGNVFMDKKSLLLHMKEDGITVTDEEMKQVKEGMKKRYE